MNVEYSEFPKKEAQFGIPVLMFFLLKNENIFFFLVMIFWIIVTNLYIRLTKLEISVLIGWVSLINASLYLMLRYIQFLINRQKDF
jgi:hypothetical protein